MCIHLVQGFSLLNVVLLWSVSCNTRIFLSKSTAIYLFLFKVIHLKTKKRLTYGNWKVSGLKKKKKKPHFWKWQHRNFCLTWLILCNIFPFFVNVLALIDSLVGRRTRMHNGAIPERFWFWSVQREGQTLGACWALPSVGCSLIWSGVWNVDRKAMIKL